VAEAVAEAAVPPLVAAAVRLRLPAVARLSAVVHLPAVLAVAVERPEALAVGRFLPACADS
jgi:hypothetical protein